MSQTTTPPNAPEVDVRSILNRAAIQLELGHIGSMNLAIEVREALAAMITREAALVAERDAALRSANIAEARVKGWEATVVITNLPSRIWPVEGWGPGEGETVAVPELTPKKLTDILDRLKAADAIADQRDALAAEVGALTSARDAYRTMLWQAEEDVKALREDAERWREVERRFNGSKTSAASMALEGLGLEPTPYRDFAETVDVARAEPGT